MTRGPRSRDRLLAAVRLEVADDFDAAVLELREPRSASGMSCRRRRRSGRLSGGRGPRSVGHCGKTRVDALGVTNETVGGVPPRRRATDGGCCGHGSA
jgi:hypothetical protein